MGDDMFSSSQTVLKDMKILDKSFQEVASQIPMMLWASSPDKSLNWFNKEWQNFTGRPKEQEHEESWLKGIHEDDLNYFNEVYFNALESHESVSVEFRLLRHDGKYRWVNLEGKPTFLENGIFTGYIGTCKDIQARKELEIEVLKHREILNKISVQKDTIINKLEVSKRLYETILSATPDLIYIFEFAEPEHKFAYANDGLVQMLGKPFEEIVGKTLKELGYEDWHADMHNQEIDTVRSTKMAIRGEVAFSGTFGRRIYDYIFAPVLNSDGDVEAVAGTTRDVTERHDTEETLKKSQYALQQADLRKDEFLAMLAHELRNPLAPISAATDLMALSEYEETRVRKSSQIIERQVKHMVGLVDDLLDVSRVTRGLVDIEKTSQNLKSIISTSVEQARPLMETKKHQLILNLCPEPTFVIGDHKRLVQIVSNLLNNAAKYTQENGKIELNLTTEGNTVEIKICDNGIGISLEDQESIFELFTQAKRSSDRSQGGLGIGLALVKSMLKLHNGSIHCFSNGLKMGSQFSITLPLLNESNPVLDELDVFTNHNLDHYSILIVDDNVDAANTLASLIEIFGHEVLIEHDSFKAIETIENTLPNICILDIGLPDMDGNELARRIRVNPSMNDATLIAVTGYGQEVDKQIALKAGFNYHLVKPIMYETLISIINEIKK